MKTFLRILGTFFAFTLIIAICGVIFRSIYPVDEQPTWRFAMALVAGISGAVFVWRAGKPKAQKQVPAPSSTSYTTKVSKATMELLSGLNIPQGVKCLVEVTGTSLTISALRQTYVIQNEQIRAVSIQTVSEMQKQYVSSVGGAVAGAMLFGGLGAIIGGAVKQKSIRSDTKLFIISYESGEGDIQYVIFKLNPGSLSTAPERIVRSYKDLTKNTRTVVEL